MNMKKKCTGIINQASSCHARAPSSLLHAQQLQRFFIRHGRGRPCDFQQVNTVTNRLLLKLYMHVLKNVSSPSYRQNKLNPNSFHCCNTWLKIFYKPSPPVVTVLCPQFRWWPLCKHYMYFVTNSVIAIGRKNYMLYEFIRHILLTLVHFS